MADGSVPSPEKMPAPAQNTGESDPAANREEAVFGEARAEAEQQMNRLEKKKEEESKDPTLEALNTLDPQKAFTEDEAPHLRKLRIVLKTLLFDAYNDGKKAQDLQKSPGLLLKYADTKTEEIAAKKWNEVYLAQTDQAADWWKELLEEITPNYKAALEEKQKIEDEKKPEKTQWMSSTLRWTLVAAGAYGAYELWDYFTDKKENKRVDRAIIGSAFTAMGIGALVGPEQMGKWSARYLNLYLGDKAFKDFWTNLKKGELLKAFQSLLFTTECPGIKEVAQKLDIPEKTIIDLKDVSWKNLNSFHNEVEGSLKSYIFEGLKSLGFDNVPGIHADDELRTATEEKKLQDFINEHKDEVTFKKDIDTLTVGQILEVFKAQGIFEDKTTAQPEGEKSPNPGDPNSPETKEALLKVSHSKAALERIKNGQVDWEDIPSELLTAAWEDSAALVVKDTGLFLVKGLALIPLSSAEILIGQFTDLAEAMHETGEWKDLLWEQNQGWWFGTYAVVNAAWAVWKGDSLRGAVGKGIRGGFRGILDSYLVLPKTAVKLYKLKESTSAVRRYVSSRSAEFTAISPEAQVHVLYDETNYYRERFLSYLEKAENTHRSGWGAKIKAHINQAIFGENWAEKMKTKYAKLYYETYGKFLEKAGRSDPAMSSLSSTGIARDEAEMLTKLKVSAEQFETTHPASSLPPEPKFLVQNPRFATHAEATAGGLRELSVNSESMTKEMERLGLNHERITLRLREMNFTPEEMEQLIREINASPNPAAEAKNFEYKLFAIKNPRLAAAYRGFTRTVGILGIVYMAYELETSKDKWNKAGELLTGAGAFAAGWEAGQAIPIPNPIAKELVAAGLGTVGAMGGATAWKSFAKPKIEKYFPNRNEIFKKERATANDYFRVVTGQAAFGTLHYLADYAGLGDDIDKDTDPLEYLRQTAFALNPSKLTSGGLPYEDRPMHDLNDLHQSAQKLKVSLESDKKDTEARIKEIQETLAKTPADEDLQIEQEELEENLHAFKQSLAKVETYLNDSWMDIKQMELIYIQTEMIDPVAQKFAELVQKKFPQKEDITAYERLLDHLKQGREGVKGNREMEIWQYLCDQSVATDGGGNVGFADFAAMTVINYRDLKFIQNLKGAPANNNAEPEGGEEKKAE